MVLTYIKCAYNEFLKLHVPQKTIANDYIYPSLPGISSFFMLHHCRTTRWIEKSKICNKTYSNLVMQPV